MPSPELLDFARLTAPTSAERPVGADLRTDPSPSSLYYQVKDARSSARAAERQALLAGNGEADVDWSPVITTAPVVLAEHSKDLEIAAFLIEGLVRKHGFAGLRDGFRLARLLIEQFGDDIYPLPDEDGVETRVAPLTGLNGEGAEGTLIAPIRNTPITDRTSVGAFNSSQYKQAVELERVPPDVKERRKKQGAVDLATFQTAVAETSAAFFGNVRDDLLAAIDEFTQLTALLDGKYGHDAPPSTSIREALAAAKTTLETVARDKLATLVPPEEPAAPATDEGPPVANEAGAQAVASDAIRSREDAFRVIQKVADYFRRNEPHTPISYALERIIRWGRLPLPELMREMISDSSSIDQMFRLIGIERHETSD